ncbi:MAG TPA: hypothetical protein VE826_03470 [Dongiaceae bacterium]|nr:hypothetical protein [Dongiaceae bacterium]
MNSARARERQRGAELAGDQIRRRVDELRRFEQIELQLHAEVLERERRRGIVLADVHDATVSTAASAA